MQKEGYDKILERSIITTEHTNEIGNGILHKLISQNEKITNIQTNMNDIHDTLKSSEIIVNGMESFWNRIYNHFSSGNKQTKTDILLEKKREQNEKSVDNIISHKEKTLDTTVLPKQTSDCERIEKLSDSINTLKKISNDINDQLQISMIKLDTLANCIDKADQRIDKTMIKCNKIIN